MYEKCNREGDEDCNEEHNYSDFCGYLSVPLNSTFGPVIRYNRIISKDNNNNKKSNNNSSNNNSSNNNNQIPVN